MITDTWRYPLVELSRSDLALLRAAASLAAHAPVRMRAEHLASPLERLADRLEPHVEPAPPEEGAPLLRAA